MVRPAIRSPLAGPTLHARLAVLATTGGVLLTTFVTVVRSWFLQWGASDLEARMALPGDGSLHRMRTRREA
jgi:hypothetical protein